MYTKKRNSYRKQLTQELKLNHIPSCIVNLSLNKTEMLLLHKGLSFIPKPKHVDKEDIEEGMESLHNQIRTRWSIANKILEQETAKPNPFQPTFNPNKTLNLFNPNKHKRSQ